MESVLIFLGLLFVLMALGVPVGLVLMLSAMGIMVALGFNDPRMVSQRMIYGINNFVLMAIPFFILAGTIMAKGGIINRLVDLSLLILGRFRGGLGYAVCLTSLIFAGLSGSALADAAALSTMLVPIMAARGYNTARSAAFIAANTVNTPLLPPSIGFVLIGVSANLSIARLFMGGIVPGIVFAIALMIGWYFITRHDGYEDRQTFPREQVWPIIKGAIPALGVPVLVIGGIRFGWFTPTEAGAFCVVYALLISVFYYKELNWKKAKEAFAEAAMTTAAIALIVAGASVVGFYMTMARIPHHMVEMLGIFVDRPLLLMLVINLFLIVVSMFMDFTPTILIFAPILVPIATAAGIDPYFFAFVMLANITIGLSTPPVGTVLFVVLKTTKVKYGEFLYKMLPFFCIVFAVLLLYIFFPQLYLVPQRFLFGR
jgi:tripartite ATP-independent transporter DctM subunit